MSGPFLGGGLAGGPGPCPLSLNQPDLARGLEVIEIGCGGGVASIAAAKAGLAR